MVKAGLSRNAESLELAARIPFPHHRLPVADGENTGRSWALRSRVASCPSATQQQRLLLQGLCPLNARRDSLHSPNNNGKAAVRSSLGSLGAGPATYLSDDASGLQRDRVIYSSGH